MESKMTATAYVVRWDCLPDFRKTFPAIELPASTDALGIEVVEGRAVLLEVFGEDGSGSFDQTLPIENDNAEPLAALADRYGDLCAA
jgi:hypothetical protein